MMPALTLEELNRIEFINAAIPGWSGVPQYAFFKGMIERLPNDAAILMCGVYQGRDLAYLLDIADRLKPGNEIRFVGVDKFSDTACADWPKDKIGKTWREAGFGEAPALARAGQNIRLIRAIGDEGVELVEQDDADYLAQTEKRFDLVYLDTAHDFETVARQLRQVRRVCKPGAIIAGDDYSDAGTWGVARAVTAAFTAHDLVAGWIWHAPLSNLKT